jgi:hypothetical protein
MEEMSHGFHFERIFQFLNPILVLWSLIDLSNWQQHENSNCELTVLSALPSGLDRSPSCFTAHDFDGFRFNPRSRHLKMLLFS